MPSSMYLYVKSFRKAHFCKVLRLQDPVAPDGAMLQDIYVAFIARSADHFPCPGYRWMKACM